MRPPGACAGKICTDDTRRRVAAGAVDLSTHMGAPDEKRLFRVQNLVLPPLIAAIATKDIPSAS